MKIDYGLSTHVAKAAGYCIISRRKPTLASRIDRPDWKEHMAAQHVNGMEWVECLRDSAADQYRRVYSKDTIQVPSSWIKILPNSLNGPRNYLPKVSGHD